MTGRMVVETVDHPMRDGVRLVADVIRIDDDRRRPVLLTRTPYGRAASRQADDVVALARAGWAVVIQDVRGRGDSGGRFRIFDQEATDGADTIERLAAEPWCDGAVAMFGGSYRGSVQWLAARHGPPALRAIAPMVAPAQYDEGCLFEGGVPVHGFGRAWALRFATSGSLEGGSLERARHLADEPLDEWSASDDAEIAALFPAYAAWNDSDHAAWRNTAAVAGVSDVPAFHSAGWYDLFCEASLRAYREAVAGGSSPQRLVVGPWSHAVAPGGVVGDSYEGPMADPERAGLRAEQFEWLAAAVDLARHGELDTGAKVFVLGAGTWIELPEWPPLLPRHELQLSADGRLVDRGGSLFDATGSPAVAGETCTIEHDPGRPAPGVGGRYFSLWPRPGPLPLPPPSWATHTASFQSPPSERAVDVIGELAVVLSPVVSHLPGQLVVRVAEVDPEGRAVTITEHGHRLSAAERGQRVRLTAGSTAWRVRPGHRIRLDLCTAAAPRLRAEAHRFGIDIELDANGGGAILELPCADVP